MQEELLKLEHILTILNEKNKVLPYTPYALLTAELGISSAKATISWCEQTLLKMSD